MNERDIIKALNEHTYEQFSYAPVTVGPSGEPITDADCDGVIYKKLVTGTYVKMMFTGPANVKWFGAKGDGVTDDSDAIRKAITSLGVTYSHLYFEEGTYLQGDGTDKECNFVIVNKSNFKITGKDAKIIANSANSAIPEHAIFILIGCHDVHIEGLYINGKLSDRTPLGSDPTIQNVQHNIGIFQSCYNITIDRCVSIESMMDGIFIGRDDVTGVTDIVVPYVQPYNILIKDCICEYSYRQGVSLVGVDNVRIEGGSLSYTSTIKGTTPGAGIDLEGYVGSSSQKNVTLDGVRIYGNLHYGVDINVNTHNCTFRNLDIQNNGGPGVMTDQRSTNNTIINCYIANNGTDRSEKAEVILRGTGNKLINNVLSTSNNLWVNAPPSPTPCYNRVIQGNYMECTDTTTTLSAVYIYLESTPSGASDIVKDNYLYNGWYNGTYAPLYVSSPSGIVEGNTIATDSPDIQAISKAWRIKNNSMIGRNTNIGYTASVMASTSYMENQDYDYLIGRGDNFISRGTGDPNGVIMAGRGSIYFQTDATGSGNGLWIKNSGENYTNTGWVKPNMTDLKKAAALTSPAPSSVTKTSSDAADSYIQADTQKMVDDISSLVTQLNATEARLADLIAKQQAAGQQT